MQLFLFLVLLAAEPGAVERPNIAPPTWSKDVAPILLRHCGNCHQPGSSAPFSLLTYADAQHRARMIAGAVASHAMPPWKPEPGFGKFLGDNHLTRAEIALIQSWVAHGAPPGDLSKLQAVPKTAAEWQLGTPDLIIDLPVYHAAADGPDDYHCFVVPKHFTKDYFVRAFEFQEGGAGLVHHALFFIDGRIKSDLPPDYPCFGTPGFLATAALGGWSPGMSAMEAPPGTATHVPNGSRLVVQLHFHPTGRLETVSSRIGLYFSTNPPARVVMDAGLASKRIDIEPGDAHYVVRDHFTLPVPVEVTGIIPHAHYVCRDMKGWAILPNGHKVWLLWIKDWDFNWQSQYRYATPLHLPADTELHMEFIYDNSAGNPHNPNSPPRRVTYGANSTDEMAGLHVQVIPRNDEEMHELGQALWGKVMRQVGGSFYRLPSAVRE